MTGDSIAGWYGKLPCLGDFASRRLPGEFIASWDAWLQHSIAWSREQLRDGWLDAFLMSPMWRFATGAGVCGPVAWTGVLVPSVDKIGRYFPLTFAFPLRESSSRVDCIFESGAWYAALENIALAALDRDFSIEALESGLGKNPFAPARAGCGLHLEGRSVWWCVEPASGATELHCVQGLPDGDRYTRMLRPPKSAGIAQSLQHASGAPDLPHHTAIAE